MTSDKEAEAWARHMVQRWGYVDAVRQCERHRDTNAQGSATFAHWQRIWKALRMFATVGPVS